MRKYEIVSTDSHLEVSPDMWRPYVAKEYHQFTPQVVKLDNGGDAWLMPGKNVPVPLGLNFSAGRGWKNLKYTGISYSEGLVGAGDSAQRLKEMDQDGMDAEFLFPAVSGQRTLDSAAIPREAYCALAHGYNEWLSDFCKADPDRLLGGAILPTTTIDDAIAELRHAASLPGIRGVVLHQWPNGSGAPDPSDDKFWALALELKMPLTSHISFGQQQAADKMVPDVPGLTNFAPINAMLTKGLPLAYTPMQMITAGVFDRFPDLRMFFAEIAIGWVPHFIERSDDEYQRHRYWANIDLKHEPSYYIRKHFSWGMWIDKVGLALRDMIGVDNIQWSTDFPHVVTDWPNSRALIEREFKDIPADEKRRIICDNAVRYFRLNEPR
ncbi:MAG: amidohydrolase family protein [Gammaproteobacteria bacterium]